MYKLRFWVPEANPEPVRLNGDSTYIEGVFSSPARGYGATVAFAARPCTETSPAPTASPWPEATSVSTAPALFEPTIAPNAVATSEHPAYWSRRVVEMAQGD